MKPLVSIIIPVFNGANYLREAIDSALAQSYSNVEVIVINDGSNDRGLTESIALSYADRIKYFYKPNGGVATALNKGIQEMSGTYFSWLSHDDLYHPCKIERQIDVIENVVGDNSIVYCDYDLIDHRGAKILECKIQSIPTNGMPLMLLTSSVIHGCSLLVPRNAFDRVGIFRDDLPTTQDYDLWFKMAFHYNFVHVKEILISSRVHPDQGSRKFSQHYKEVCEFYKQRLPNLKPAWIRGVFSEDEWYPVFGQMLQNYSNLGCISCVVRGWLLSFRLKPKLGLRLMAKFPKLLCSFISGAVKRNFQW